MTGILTGPLGDPVKMMLKGANLAFAENLAQGGIDGREVRLVALDDSLNPKTAVENYRTLMGTQGLVGFFGSVGSATTSAAAPILKESGCPLFGAYAVADSARESVKGSAFFLRATNARELEVLVQHLTTIGVVKIAIAHLNNPGGNEVAGLCDKAISSKGYVPTSTVNVNVDGSNIEQAAKIIAASKPQAVIMYLGGSVATKLMEQTWAAGSVPTFYGMSIVPGDTIAKAIGEKAKNLIISQVIPYPWSQSNDVARSFRRLADKESVPISYYSYEGYLNALVMIAALKKCEKDVSRQRLQTVLRSLNTRVGGLDVDFTDGGHTGSRFVELVQLRADGGFVR
nr:ABC transporter substrate-binding protein [Acidovorax sp. Root402]